MKLFAIYVGGELAGANIELHDMRFVVAPSILKSHDALRAQWWGVPNSLHIDCWAELDHADGYDVELRTEPFMGVEKLYYVNLGGFDPTEFSEKHKNVFVVADTPAEAKARALKSDNGLEMLHRDDMYEAEQVFALNDSAYSRHLHIHLTPVAEPRTLRFTCGYTPIRKRA